MWRARCCGFCSLTAQKRFSKQRWYQFIEKHKSLNGLFVNTEVYSRTGHRMFECECAGDLEGGRSQLSWVSSQTGSQNIGM
jgi:hypothetical protein